MRSLKAEITSPVPIIKVEPKPKYGALGEQDTNRQGELLWIVQAMLPNAFDGEDVAKIIVAGEKPAVTFGDLAEVHGFKIQMWERENRAGLTLRAEKIIPAIGGEIHD